MLKDKGWWEWFILGIYNKEGILFVENLKEIIKLRVSLFFIMIMYW